MACKGDIERESRLKKLNEKHREEIYVLRSIKKNTSLVRSFMSLLKNPNVQSVVESYEKFSTQKRENKLENGEEVLRSFISFFNNIEFKNVFMHYLLSNRRSLFAHGEINPLVNNYKNLVERINNPRILAEEKSFQKKNLVAFLEKSDLKTLVLNFDKSMKLIESLTRCFVEIVVPQGRRQDDEDRLITSILLEAMFRLDRMPNNARLVRQRNRCAVTGRARSYDRFTGLGRHALRDLASKGLLPGFRKASW